MFGHGTMCRCERVTGIRKDGKLYSHSNPYGGHCPYSGVTPEDANNGITWLARRLLDTGHTKDPVTGKWVKSG